MTDKLFWRRWLAAFGKKLEDMTFKDWKNFGIILAIFSALILIPFGIRLQDALDLVDNVFGKIRYLPEIRLQDSAGTFVYGPKDILPAGRYDLLLKIVDLGSVPIRDLQVESCLVIFGKSRRRVPLQERPRIDSLRSGAVLPLGMLETGTVAVHLYLSSRQAWDMDTLFMLLVTAPRPVPPRPPLTLPIPSVNRPRPGRPLLSRLLIESSPPGAAYFLMRQGALKDKGITNREVDLEIGAFRVRMELPSHLACSTDVKVPEDKVAYCKLRKLLAVELAVPTRMDDAAVFLNGAAARVLKYGIAHIHVEVPESEDPTEFRLVRHRDTCSQTLKITESTKTVFFTSADNCRGGSR